MCLGYRHLWRLGRIVGLEGVSMNQSAFPTGIIANEKGQIIGGSNGLTLRDYFAAKAMQSLILAEHSKNEFNEIQAVMAYEVADAMMKAREL